MPRVQSQLVSFGVIKFAVLMYMSSIHSFADKNACTLQLHGYTLQRLQTMKQDTLLLVASEYRSRSFHYEF